MITKLYLYLERTGEVFIEVWATICRNKLRTSLTGCAVSVGIFLLIFLIGSGNGIIHALEHSMGSMPLDVINVYPGNTSKPYAGMQTGRRITFDNHDLQLSSPMIDEHVVGIASTLSEDSITLYHGDRKLSGSLLGVFPIYRTMEEVKLVAGRFINDTDQREKRKVIILGQANAKQLFGSAQSALGAYVQANSIMYQIIGVKIDNAGQGMGGDTESFIPFSTFRAIYSQGKKEIGNLSLKTQYLKTPEENTAFETSLRSVLAALHSFAPDDKNAVWMFNSTTGATETNKAMDILREAIWIIGLLTLLSGIVGISNIMLISVKERTREFGIRKALGAKPAVILREVILESILVTLFFGYVGLVIGVLSTEYLDYISHAKQVTIAGNTFVVFLNPTVDLGTGLRALCTLVVAGIIAGYLPARKATRIKPIEALRG